MTDKELEQFAITVPFSLSEMKYIHDSLRAEFQTEQALRAVVKLSLSAHISLYVAAKRLILIKE